MVCFIKWCSVLLQVRSKKKKKTKVTRRYQVENEQKKKIRNQSASIATRKPK